ncbi:MAG: toll/interleukin-1 receptor domain-containing protein [Chloroflexi bacterium]|nr:toll/interleukin-1 receptor domain-containing protein [Chloroflexota bacterium]
MYDDLLIEGYPVWMDKAMEELKEWKPQIEDNLRNSNRYVVLISSHSVKSKWVLHEGSMAYALKRLIIPLLIEKFEGYSAKDLPIWVEEIQLVNFVEDFMDYPNRLKKLKQYLGEPLPIQKHLEEMVIQYKTSGMLLGEVALDLIEKHKDKIVLPEGAKELIERSRRFLQDYRTRYANLEKDYEMAKITIDDLEKKYQNLSANMYDLEKKNERANIDNYNLLKKIKLYAEGHTFLSLFFFILIVLSCYILVVVISLSFM